MPLAVLLGGSTGPVPAYNSNGLWLTEPSTLAAEAKELVDEGSFVALKLRLGRDHLSDDIEPIKPVRSSVGPAFSGSASSTGSITILRNTP